MKKFYLVLGLIFLGLALIVIRSIKKTFHRLDYLDKTEEADGKKD